MAINSFKAAAYICNLSNWSINNLKVNQLLYIAHMMHLGRTNTPLVDEIFQATMFGPVLPTLFKELKMFGNSPIRKQFFPKHFFTK